MADPVTALQTAADTVNATHSLLTALISFLPTAGYAITAAAAFIPKPDNNAPGPVKFIYKAVNLIAFNIKNAHNAVDDRRKESRGLDEQASNSENRGDQL